LVNNSPLAPVPASAGPAPGRSPASAAI